MLWTVIIPTISRAGLLSKTLDGLSDQSLRDFEVIIICDGKDEDTRLLSNACRPTFPLRWIFLTENAGQAAARNIGAEEARGDFLWFLDDDTVPAPDCLFYHNRFHEFHAGLMTTAVVGSVILNYEQTPRSNAERFLRAGRAALQSKSEATWGDSSNTCFYFGLNCSISRDAFVRFCGFDPQLRHVDEDLEFGQRLHTAGINFKYEPRGVVVHHDTKDLVDYCIRCWKLTAEADMHRAYRKHEPCRETCRLVRIWTGGLFSRTKERFCWHFPAFTRLLAEFARYIGEVADSDFCFRWWCRLGNSADYWKAVQAAGYSLEDLRELATLAHHEVDRQA